MKAEAVFDALFKGGYVAPFEWRNLNKQTSYYPVSFFCQKCKLNVLHTFQVTVKDGEHLINDNSVRLFAKLHGIEIDFTQTER